MKFGLLFAFVLLFTGRAVCAEPIAIGSKKFTESYVLGEIAKTLLERAGFDVSHREGMGGTAILWQALLRGDISLYPEYTGTIAEEILKANGPLTLEEIRAALVPYGIGATQDLGFNDGYSLVMRRAQADKLGIKTISDLKKHPELRAGPTPEFLGRQDGWKPLLARYNLNFDNTRSIEHGLGYAALKAGQIDIKDSYTTDARLADHELVTLEDDQNFFPQNRAVFLYRLDTQPGAVKAIRKLEGKISEAKMMTLNSEAERTKSYAAAAASYFAGDAGAASDKPRASQNPLAALPRLTAQHLTLVGISLFAAIIVSIPLGIVASRPGLLSQLILGSAGVIQTIPSLALLAFMIPPFGIGAKPAIIALFLYSLLPIIETLPLAFKGFPHRFAKRRWPWG